MPLNNPAPAALSMKPSVAIAETVARPFAASGIFALPAGGLRMTLIEIERGKLVTSITFLAANTVPSALTGLWAALYDQNLNLLAQSPNDAAPTWTESTYKTFTLNTPVATAYSGHYYVGICETGTTRNGLASLTITGNPSFLAPAVSGTSNASGLTTTAPAVADALSSTTTMAYAYVS